LGFDVKDIPFCTDCWGLIERHCGLELAEFKSWVIRRGKISNSGKRRTNWVESGNNLKNAKNYSENEILSLTECEPDPVGLKIIELGNYWQKFAVFNH
jgi:hypothetical protein